MELNLNTPIDNLKGIGASRSETLKKKGIFTAEDLLGFFPRTYENRGEIKKLFECSDGETASVIVRIDSDAKASRGRSGISYVKCTASDDTAPLTITFFNNSWIASSLTRGRVFRVYGKFTIGAYSRETVNPIIENYEKDMQSVYPIYSVSGSITQKMMYRYISQVLPLADETEDVLPKEIINEFGLSKKSEAIKAIHFPSTMDDMKKSVKTLAFEELTVFQLAIRRMRSTEKEKNGIPFTQKDTGIRLFFEKLPFSLTNAQMRTIKEIFADLQKTSPMMRLVQGDVGSGKTVVAVSAAFLCVKNGYQACIMAPTEILAEQHYKTFEKMLSPFGIKTILVTGSLTASQKNKAKEMISSGEAEIIIGTNAVIQSSVEFKSLGLAVTDEQHRFGVMQRANLVCKGNNGKVPHTLVMSATPIPRTLSLILYGDLDISIIDELPPGRIKVETIAIPSEKREKVNSFLRGEMKKGRQVFVVCPLVSESELLEAESAEERFECIKKDLPEFDCGLLHGKMKPKEKDAVMNDFRSGKINLLVSTTVIEVGVDVPNATVMVVENAERFGLSTLHQLRGRIGRGNERSYCVLLYDKETKNSKERLETMCRTNNGFEIAKTDLKLRGPGDFFGERQSGEIRFQIADMADMELIEQTKAVVDTILDNNLLKNDEYIPLLKKSDELWLKNIRKNTLN